MTHVHTNNTYPRRESDMPIIPWSKYCRACGKEGLQRIGGLWCTRCRLWLNDHRKPVELRM